MVELVSSALPDLSPMVRSKGRHVSSAIRKLCIQFGHFEDTPFPEDKTRLELGNSFEDGLAFSLGTRLALNSREPDKWVRIGEQMVDSIYGTPDFIDTVDMVGREVKLTWLSISHDPMGKKFWKYWLQCKAYGYMLGIDTWILHIAHIMGNWQYPNEEPKPCPHCGKPGKGPHYHEWKQTFTQSELYDAWAMIKAYA